MRNGEFVSGPLQDGLSNAIVAGGVAQTISTAKPRRYMMFQNISDTDMWLGVGATAVADAPSIKVPGNTTATLIFEDAFVPNQAISLFCATISKRFVFKEAF